jgi:hypothetical protein
MEQVICIIIGWLLGLLGQPLVSRIEKSYKRDDYKRVIFSELKSLASRLTSTCFKIQKHLGIESKESLIWMKAQYEKHEEDFPESIIEAINKILEVPDAQFNAAVQMLKATENMGLHLKTYNLPFVEAVLENLFVFDSKFQRSVLDIYAQVNILNEDNEKLNDFHRLTFETAHTNDNYNIIKANLNVGYFEVQRRCKLIVDKINTIIV